MGVELVGGSASGGGAQGTGEGFGAGRFVLSLKEEPGSDQQQQRGDGYREHVAHSSDLANGATHIPLCPFQPLLPATPSLDRASKEHVHGGLSSTHLHSCLDGLHELLSFWGDVFLVNGW